MNKFHIELNGVANIKLLMDELTSNAPNNDEILVPAAKIYQQLDILERYMLALSDAASLGLQPPAWHEVVENRKKFPSIKERMK
jgi:hypothetical protein